MNHLIPFPTEKDLEKPSILKELVSAHRHLAELKGLVQNIPNEKILLMNLTLQEAKDSSAIENIITTQDNLYKHYVRSNQQSPQEKEIHNYSEALLWGCNKVKSSSGISCNAIIEIQKMIEPKKPGFRKVPGTVLKNTSTNVVVYTPPSPEKIPELMKQLETFINTSSIDPLIKMAISHAYFESIHPFYHGNGRTGRIINILCLLLNDLLESPVLYLSRYILNNRSDYYRLLQEVREQEDWENWIIYNLRGVSVISQQTKKLVRSINELFKQYKSIIREKHKFYSHDLINNIFSHPYTKVKFLERDMKISRATATRYLDTLVQEQLLEKNKMGKENYYLNRKLFEILKNS